MPTLFVNIRERWTARRFAECEQAIIDWMAHKRAKRPGRDSGAEAMEPVSVFRMASHAVDCAPPVSDVTIMASPIIAPSILSADFARLGEDTSAVLAAGADWVHFDVMDNHYVPNLTIGPMVCEALRKHGITAPIDVHLMVTPVDDLIKQFARAGASSITFHPEASPHVDRSLQLIKDEGCQAGLVFNPATPLTLMEHVMDKLDMVLLMSVNPGFGGQAFLPSTLPKLRQARALIDASGRDIRLEIDGGVKTDNIAEIAAAGADTFVAGSAIFNADDYATVIKQMRAEIAGASA